VLLFDEIDKPVPEVLDVLLQILDKGEFSSGSGAQFAIKDSIVICTTNASQAEISKAGRPLGFTQGSADAMAADALKGIRRQFRPELLNRFSQICVFNTLKPEDIERLVASKLKPRFDDWRTNLNLAVEIDEDAMKAICRLAIDDKSGARELNRVIERVVIKGIIDALAPDDFTDKTVGISISAGDVQAATKDELARSFSYKVAALPEAKAA